MQSQFSQGGRATDGDLDDMGGRYRQLLAGTLSVDNLSQESGKKADKNMRWTRVVTREYFEISGLGEFKLEEDVAEAWDEIDDVSKEMPSDEHDGRNAWAPLFNPKDLEHVDYSKDPEDYRLPANELEELGKHVAMLR
jgi:hypothetical protein